MKFEKLLPLTVIILTHRADQRFQKALASSQFADEVLVFDFNSNNDWQKLSKKYQFRLIKNQDNKVTTDAINTGTTNNKITDFSQVRQKALEQTSFEWVFFLDSDEIINPTSIANITHYLQSDYAAVAVVRQDIFLGKILNWGEVASVTPIRLMRKGRVKFSRPVHETTGINGSIAQSDIKLWHYAHQSVNEFLSDIDHYTELETSYRWQQSQNEAKSHDPSHTQQPTKRLNLSLIFFEMLIYPSAKFIWNYFFKLGLLDGYRGFCYALMMSLHSLMVRIKLYEKATQLPPAV